MNIILGSSDSFFLNDIAAEDQSAPLLRWLSVRHSQAFIDLVHVRTRISVFSIGHLSREDAEKYYEHVIAELKLSADAVPPFDRVYTVVGGHMLHMRQFMQVRAAKALRRTVAFSSNHCIWALSRFLLLILDPVCVRVYVY